MKISVKEKNNINAEMAIASLINKFFWKSKTGPLMTVLLPFSFMIIYKLLSKDSIQFFVDALPAFISLSILPITLITLPQMLVEIKQSIILRRISTSSITAIKYNLIVASWFFVLCIFSTIIVLIIFLCFLNVNVAKLSFVLWGEVIYALIMFYISAISVGIIISSIAKKSSSSQLIGLSLMFITLIFGGQFVPINVIGEIDSIKYISIFSPINYSSGLLNNTLINPGYNQSGSIFSITDFKMISSIGEEPKEIIIIASWQKVLNLVMPPIIFVGLNFIAYKNFKWSAR